MKIRGLLFLGILSLLTSPATALSGETIRVGHFPNITHTQGLVAQHLSRSGRGWFEQRLGADIKIEWYIYNAGPSAMEAILADSIDLTYVGPSPALNVYAKSNGESLPVLQLAAQPWSSNRTLDWSSLPIFAGRRLPPRNSAIPRTLHAGLGWPMGG
jgi:NitT/TauT family transport system substrate-binding protein